MKIDLQIRPQLHQAARGPAGHVKFLLFKKEEEKKKECTKQQMDRPLSQPTATLPQTALDGNVAHTNTLDT